MDLCIYGINYSQTIGNVAAIYTLGIPCNIEHMQEFFELIYLIFIFFVNRLSMKMLHSFLEEYDFFRRAVQYFWLYMVEIITNFNIFQNKENLIFLNIDNLWIYILYRYFKALVLAFKLVS